MEPIEIPIDGVLDLHTFRPAEVKDLLDDYIAACLEKKIYSLRIIHGKGQGVLKKRVHSLLKKDSRVASFTDAGATGGGWGATVVELTGTK
ncbi:MAG: Smr/MutS family protein [Desulfobacterales bacterium]|nr:Smr/MutS family protein [Desulfobacterales bacterium]